MAGNPRVGHRGRGMARRFRLTATDKRRYLRRREGGRDLVRRAVEDGGRLPAEVWDRMLELGWAGLLVPEDLGGTGLGLVDLTVASTAL